MQDGDYVIVEESGEMQFVRERPEGSGNVKFVGRVVDLRDPPEDSIVELEPSQPNVMPVLATVARVRELFG